ncbi:cytidine deaminase [Patescibacteria group bacterium]|nr:cytidine deaminase [Patescibacteria group bacterium]
MKNEELIQEAIEIVNPKTIANAEMGGVGCALMTDKGTIFKGVCIDTISGMGFYAEHTAISQMITQGEYLIKKIVAVKKGDDGNVIIMPPCGRCREFMYQTNPDNLKAEVILEEDRIVTLEELLPYRDI